MTDAHAAAVLAIYQAGMDEGNATFETRVPGWDASTAARLPGHRFVATAADQVTGRRVRTRPLAAARSA
jgi:L-amino acid N-acyltransferase YncA